MLRPYVLKTDTDLKTMASTLLDARFKGAQAEAALAQLTAANPHIDPDKIPAGTMILVPDSPGFRAAAASSVQSAPFADFRESVADALAAAAARMKSGNAARAAERDAVAAAIKSAAFKRLAGEDPELSKQAEAALVDAKQEAEDDAQAEKSLSLLGTAVLAAIDQLAEIAG